MSVTTVRTIFCDECSQWWQGRGESVDEPVSTARERLKRAGWLVGVRGGLDYCPDCVAELEGREK